jgi:hypothetical protein
MKNETNIVYFNSSRLQSSQDDGSEAGNMISMMLCLFGAFTRNKIFIWMAIYFTISTLCRRRYSSSLAQHVINLVMLLFAIVVSYVFIPQSV